MLNPIKAKALFFLFVLDLLISPPKHRAWNVASYPCPLKTFSNKINHKQSVQQENRNRELNSKCMRKCLSIIREHHFDALREIMHSLNDRVYLLLLIKPLKMVCQSIPNFSISFLGSFLLVSGRNFTSMVFPMRSFWILRLRTLKFSLSGWCGFLLFGAAFNPGIRKALISSFSPRPSLTLISVQHWHLLTFHDSLAKLLSGVFPQGMLCDGVPSVHLTLRRRKEEECKQTGISLYKD